MTDFPTCGVCGLTCEIAHKAHSVELKPGRVAWFHDAHERDCWTLLKRYIKERHDTD